MQNWLEEGSHWSTDLLRAYWKINRQVRRLFLSLRQHCLNSRLSLYYNFTDASHPCHFVTSKNPLPTPTYTATRPHPPSLALYKYHPQYMCCVFSLFHCISHSNCFVVTPTNNSFSLTGTMTSSDNNKPHCGAWTPKIESHRGRANTVYCEKLVRNIQPWERLTAVPWSTQRSSLCGTVKYWAV